MAHTTEGPGASGIVLLTLAAGQFLMTGVPGAIASVADGMASAVLVVLNPVYGL